MQYLAVVALFVGVVSAADQNPKVWDALAKLRGKELSVQQIQELYPNVVPGTDFPTLSEIPARSIDCASFHQPGFYADSDVGRCQVFDRCDVNGNLTSYLCPNMTLFNQITLVCDWWYNVDCSQSKQFVDYSNSRLYQETAKLLDNQDEVAVQAVVKEATGAVNSSAAKKSNKSGKKKSKASGSAAASSSSA